MEISRKNSEKDLEIQKLRELFRSEMIQQSQDWIKKYNNLMAYYRCAIMEIETKFNVLNEEFSLRYDRNPINSIHTRLKSMESVREKLERKGLPMDLNTIEENLMDIAGVRVICAFPDDVYMLEQALLKQDDVTLIERKDYIANPKENGYRSLHLIVAIPIFLAQEKRMMNVEIQLRTIAMDSWASLEHQLRYKKDVEFTEDMAKDLFYCAQLSAELDAKMDALQAKAKIDTYTFDEE